MIGTGPCHQSPCAERAISVLGAFSWGISGLDTCCTLEIVEGTKLGFGWLKRLRRVLVFFAFTFLSHFALDSKQIFFPWCCFSRFASPTVPQCIWVPQSRHSAYPSASRTAAWLPQRKLVQYSSIKNRFIHTCSDNIIVKNSLAWLYSILF